MALLAGLARPVGALRAGFGVKKKILLINRLGSGFRDRPAGRVQADGFEYEKTRPEPDSLPFLLLPLNLSCL